MYRWLVTCALATAIFVLAGMLPPVVIVSSNGHRTKVDLAGAISALSRRLLYDSQWLSGNLRVHLLARRCLISANNSQDDTSSLTSAAATSGGLIVPHIFHMIRFDQPVVTFVEMLAIKSVLRLNPCAIVIHCNVHPWGRRWDAIKDDKRVVVHYEEPPADIFGVEPHWVQHKSDLARLRILREYGGVYLDNDCLMLRPIDHLRRHSCVVAKSRLEQYMGNMFIVAAPDCRFLAMHEELYRTSFDRERWYYNAGELPTVEILYKHPDVAHVVDEGVEMGMISRLFLLDEPVAGLAQQYDVVHTFYNHRYVIKDTVDYDAVDYHQYRNTFANIARWLLDND